MAPGSRLARLVLPLLLLLLAGCPSRPPVVPTPPGAEDRDLEVVLSVPYRADAGQPRTLSLRFTWLGPDAPAEVAWELVVRAEPEGDAASPPLRTLTGRTPLVAGTGSAQVEWDGRDQGGREVAGGRYAAVLTARAGGLSEQATRPLAVGLIAALPVPIDGGNPDGAASRAGRPAPGGLPFTVFLGNLHSQSNHSDGGGDPATCAHAERPRAGVGDPAAAFEYARTVARLDFLALSEHNHMYDGDPNSAAPHADAGAARALFDQGRRLAAEHRAAHPGFVALYGTEFGVVTGGGHVNLFNPGGLVTWERNGAGELLGHLLVERSDYRALYALMKQQGIVGQFNHPDPDQFAAGGEAMAWDAAGDEVMCLCEVANAPAFSNRTDESDPDINLYEAGFHRLLLRGYHVAPTSDQDNHCANWGRSARNRTGVLLPAGATLDDATLLEALRARRTFATTDRTAQVVLRAGGHLMGERFEAGPGPIAVEVLYGSERAEPIESLDLMVGHQGGVRVSPRRLDRASTTLDRLDPGDWFAYARVRQPDGDTLWSAPVWLHVR